MSPEQEAQQAETIAEIRERLENPEKHNDPGQTYEDALFLMGEVDSQAQKIAEQAREIEKLKERIAELHAYIDESQAVR